MVICLSSSAPRAWGTFHLVLNFSFIFFQVFRIGKAAQILFLEFIKDGLADLGDKFKDGGLANQPVTLKGRVGFSCGQVSQCFY